MKQVIVKEGKIVIENVPAPAINNREILVQVYYSCISAGTELSALKDNSILQNVVRLFINQDVQGMELGYSAAGIVLEVGPDIKDIKKGDRIACAGGGIANHAEFIAVPRNLAVRIPDGLALDLSSTVSLGAIALQSIRRLDPNIGESIAVIGLGVLGQLCAQMLKLSGCRVIGIDPDRRRTDMAVSMGIEKDLNPAKDDVVNESYRFSEDRGLDGVIITASAKNEDLVNEAMKLCRKKGRVVIVGDVGLNLKRADFYKKELDLLISTSYGPGRYDERYEKKGHDYPYSYVRWTENRNMEEYLRLLSERKIDVKTLVEKIYPVSIAADAYDDLRTLNPKPLITLLEYSKESVPEKRVQVSNRRISKGILNIGLIGAGSFAKGTILPAIDRMRNMYNVYAIASKTGVNAKAVAKRYRANYATTDYKEILSDKNIDMVLIGTRHDLHARIAIEAASAGKAVFLEKPMALCQKELDELTAVLNETKVPFTVGFNRRFSPYIKMIKDSVAKRTNPMMINYQLNAWHVSKEHWIFSNEGGGRNIGEACHVYDLFNFLTGSEVSKITTISLTPKTQQYSSNDNFVATIKYADGSVCNLIYTALGAREYQKECMTVFFDGRTIRMDDYKKMESCGGCDCRMENEYQEKGYREEFVAFAASIKSGDGYSIPIRQLIQATEISFAVEKKI